MYVYFGGVGHTAITSVSLPLYYIARVYTFRRDHDAEVKMAADGLLFLLEVAKTKVV